MQPQAISAEYDLGTVLNSGQFDDLISGMISIEMVVKVDHVGGDDNEIGVTALLAYVTAGAKEILILQDRVNVRKNITSDITNLVCIFFSFQILRTKKNE